MATDATGTPTSLGIPTYDTSVDAPSGLGFNATMAIIDTLLQARVPLSLVTTAGDLVYATGSAALTRLPIGTSSQVLTVSGGAPVWATLPSGGSVAPSQITQDGATSGQALVWNGSGWVPGLPTDSDSDSDPQTVTGFVQGNGTISGGTGFSVTYNSTGNYTVNFSPAFSATPAVTIGLVYSTGGNLIAHAITAAGASDFVLQTGNGFVGATNSSASLSAQDCAFMFLATAMH